MSPKGSDIITEILGRKTQHLIWLRLNGQHPFGVLRGAHGLRGDHHGLFGTPGNILCAGTESIQVALSNHILLIHYFLRIYVQFLFIDSPFLISLNELLYLTWHSGHRFHTSGCFILFLEHGSLQILSD